MCAHGYEYLKNDDDFLKKLNNTFLIRDPAKAIASYYAMHPEVTIEEIGLAQLCGIFEKVRNFERAPLSWMPMTWKTTRKALSGLLPHPGYSLYPGISDMGAGPPV